MLRHAVLGRIEKSIDNPVRQIHILSLGVDALKP